jgi:WD40 repeat protein
VRGQYLASLGDKQTTRLLDTDGPGAFADPDRVLFFREGVLYVQRLDLANARMIGDPVPVASGFQINETAPPRVSASRTGVIAFMIDPEVSAQVQWIDRTGKPLQEIGEPVTNVIDGALSPDGRTIALARLEKSDTFLWLMDVSRGTLSRFTNGGRPAWSPDGTRIGFNSSRDGFVRIYWQPVGVSAPAELAFKSSEAQNMVDWSHEGDRLVFSSQSADNARDLWIVPIAGADRTPMPIVQTKAEERGGSISPDGRWFAYESNETGSMAVFVRRFPDGARAWRVSTGEGTAPFWRADSGELYYRTGGRLMAVRFDSAGDSPSLGAPVALFALQPADAPPMLPLRSRTDGVRFLVAVVASKVAPAARMTVIVNFGGT